MGVKLFNLSFLLLFLSPKTLRINLDENPHYKNCMKKDKPKNQNIFQSVADRLSRFFGKEETTEHDLPQTDVVPSEQHAGAPMPTSPSQETIESQATDVYDETNAPSKPVRVRRSRVRFRKPMLSKGEKGKKERAEETTPIYELPADKIGPAIRDFVLAHLSDEKLSVETMAAQLKVSRTNLYTIVHREFGVTPANFILDLRLKNAETLLKQGLKVREVAMKCGFIDPKYFSKVFKKYYGILPSSYSA